MSVDLHLTSELYLSYHFGGPAFMAIHAHVLENVVSSSVYGLFLWMSVVLALPAMIPALL